MAEKTRLLFIDLLRGWAILVMIEVHVFNAFISPVLKETRWFSILNFINGLVAPSFLFISGFAFIISTQSQHDELHKFGSLFRKKMSRIGLIFFVGYSLHVPFFSLAKIFREATPQLWISFYNVDVLQNIGVGLLYILLARVFIKSDRVFYYFLFVSSIVFVYISPYIWDHDFGRYFPVPIAAYFNPVYGSFFPLFPWIGFLLVGAVCSILYLRAREAGNERNFMIQTAIFGLILIAIGHFYLSPIFPRTYTAIKPHPVFFLERLGYVLILLSLCWYYINKVNTKGGLIIMTGRESLLVYWLHLQLIYRMLWHGESFDSLIKHSYNPWQCLLFTLGLIAVMIVVAKIWGDFKRTNRKAAKIVTTVVLCGALLIFVLLKNY